MHITFDRTLCGRTDQQMEEGRRPLGLAQPFHPNILAPAGCCEHPPGGLPPAYLLTPGVRRHRSVDLEGSLPCRSRPRGGAYTSRLPSSWPLCSSRWQCPGVGEAAECEDYLVCQHADHLPPRSPRTRERRRGTPKAPWTAATMRERLPGRAGPGRVAIIRPCAPYDPRRRTRSFPVGRSPSPVVRDHAFVK